MQVLLLGHRLLDFTTSDGTAIKGCKLYYAFTEDGVNGRMCDSLFVRDDFPLPALKPGQTLDISFNRKGKAESVVVVEK